MMDATRAERFRSKVPRHLKSAAPRRPNAKRPPRRAAVTRCRCLASDGQEIPGARVGGRVTQLRHRPGLDLADPLPGEVEVLADLLQGAGLTPVQPEAQRQDLALALVERGQ